MKVGDLVRMIDDPHNIVGVIVEELVDNDMYHSEYNGIYYRVSWLDNLCDTSYADESVLEVLSESR